MKTLVTLLALGFVALAPSAGMAQNDLNAILTSTARPQEDRDGDAARKPAEVLRFFGIERGDKVADLLTGGGYWTRILVPLVGAEGRVYAGNNPFFGRFYTEAFNKLLAEPAFKNVVRIDGPVDKLALPKDGSLDAVIMVNAYHDLFLVEENRGQLNRDVLASLKPGGVYGIIDHAAAAGAGSSAVQTLHRIEKKTVVDEVTAAGFKLGGESNILATPADDHTAKIFDLDGKTDKFVLRFEKP